MSWFIAGILVGLLPLAAIVADTILDGPGLREDMEVPRYDTTTHFGS